MSIILVRFLYTKGYNQTIVSPISHINCSLLALLYVDDTDLNLLNLDSKSIHEIIQQTQFMLDI